MEVKQFLSAVRSREVTGWQLGVPWKCCPSTLEVIYLIVLWGQLTLGEIALLVKKLWLVQKPECGLKVFKLGKHDVHRASSVKLKFITNTWRSRLKYLLIFCLTTPAMCVLNQNLCNLNWWRRIKDFLRDHFWSKSLNNCFSRTFVEGTGEWYWNLDRMK